MGTCMKTVANKPISDPLLYRVVHKSVKHFKNSQQINYSSIMVILTPIENESLQVFF
jgi:hypothetical protein